MVTFEVATGGPLFLIGVILSVLAAVMLAAALIFLLTGKKRAGSSSGLGRVFFVVFIIAAAPGLTFLIVHPTNSEINVGSKYITISGTYIGTTNYSSSDIMAAFVGNIHTGNLTISSKINGRGGGHLSVNEGLFFLSNGGRAYVITVNDTALFVMIRPDFYLVLGTTNTSSLVSAFSQNVYPVKE